MRNKTCDAFQADPSSGRPCGTGIISLSFASVVPESPISTITDWWICCIMFEIDRIGGKDKSLAVIGVELRSRRLNVNSESRMLDRLHLNKM